ncbi:MAG: proton-conducting transporter membrane subunit, partial [Parachlamydiales bacterium]
KNIPEAVFSGCLLFFLAAMTLVLTAQHFGLLWIAMEATTLASAPLIYFHRSRRSLEATWKYLLICSVGIALALLGNLFLVVANPNEGAPFLISKWIEQGKTLNPHWLKAAFLFFFVGYGTKMGLAPMHTWLPDAHSEAPSLVSALLSGALLNCAFFSLLRVYQVCLASGLEKFAREIFLIFGLISVFLPLFFIIRQMDFKRMLAYSSIENMGILSLAIGFGGGAIWGGLFHVLNHSLTKALLFLVAGNIVHEYQTKQVFKVSALSRKLPISGALWMIGFLAITGTPPFATFLSKFIILKAAVSQGYGIIAAIVLVFLAAIFIAMAKIFLGMFQKKDAVEIEPAKEPLLAVLSPIILAVLVLLLGFCPFSFLEHFLKKTATLLEVFL